MKRLIATVAVTIFLSLHQDPFAQTGKSLNRSFKTDDTTYVMENVVVTGSRIMNGIGQLGQYHHGIIYAGMKNELLEIDSLDANKAINNTRQILGRIPGVSITENEMSGFTANGIGFRGFNPYQSIETNTRQNGYNISADIYGYNEAYYLPPMEAVKSIIVLRDGAALSFGPQLGGVVNYELKDGSSRPIEVNSSETVGSYGLFSSFNSVGGTKGNFRYYGYLQYRRLDGWRINSKQSQWSGYASLTYSPSENLTTEIQYSSLRNLIQMPGGENDSMFFADPRASLRARNWLSSPWNIVAAKIDYRINDNSSLNVTSSYLTGQRNLIWRNEDIPPQEPDGILPDLTYAPRELEREYFNTLTSELRFLSNYDFLGENETFSIGLRYAYSHLTRKGGADGTNGTGFDLTQVSPWKQNMDFYTTNLATYVQNIFRFGSRFSITPGLRLEFLGTTANGYSENHDESSNQPYVYANNERHDRIFLLSAVSAEFKTSDVTNIYANFSQSYRPITYSDLTPFGSVARIDRNLKDASATQLDFGFRGIVDDLLNFDISLYYVHVINDIGIIEQTYDTLTYQLKTNTGADDHRGIEAYVEMNILGGLFHMKGLGKLGVYNSFAYTNSRYVSGKYTKNHVPYSPEYIERFGINYSLDKFSMNIEYSYTASSFSDPANTKFSTDGLVGIIPSYSVIDLSASYKLQKYQFRFGVNNLTDRKYFTMRTDEYPGPGIIPSIGRMIYAGLSLTL